MFTLNLSHVQELKNYLTCPKCNKLTEDPRKLYNCRHILCLKCLKSSNFKCPKCHSMFVDRDITQPDIYTTYMLNLVHKIDTDLPGQDCSIKNIPVNFFKQAHGGSQNISASGSVGEYVCPELGMNTLRRIAFVMKRNPKGESPLHIACTKGMVNDILDLIAKGVDINVTDWANWTPLHEAVQSESVQCIEVLLSNGALVNVTGEDYRTPLFQAISIANEDIVRLLLQYGADKNILDYSGITPMDIKTTSAVSEILATTERLEVLPEIYLYYQSGAVIFTLGIDRRTIKKLSNHKYILTRDSNTKNIFLCVLGNSTPLSHLDVLKFIARGIMIIREKDLGRYLSSGFPYIPELIPVEIRNALLKSIKCHLEKKPSLFDGMNFHISHHQKPVKLEGCLYSKSDLGTLIKEAGGTLLLRPPAERTIGNMAFRPYHCQTCDALKTCCNYIVYSEKEPPLLLYNMSELRHVSSRWIVESLMSYEISI